MQKHIFILLFIGLTYNGYTQDIRFFNADGFFSIGTQSNRTAAITLVDIDKDGDLDALVANGRHWAEQNYVYYNDGLGSFRLAQPIGRYLDASYKLQSADFDQDGYIDIAVANDRRIDSKIYYGNVEQEFIHGVSIGSAAPSRNMELADIDNDGDIDIILSNRKARNEILINNGQRDFSSIIHFGAETDQTIQTKAVDINQDGYLDLITAERDTINKIYINDGQLGFYNVIEFGEVNEETRAVAIGDFNKDGYLDILSGNLKVANKLFFGSKTLIFKKEYSFPANHQTSSIQIADLNKDGYLDILEGNFEEQNFVYLGSESGDFQAIGLREDLQDDTYSLAIGDLNDDGLLDLVISNSGAWNLFYRTRKMD